MICKILWVGVLGALLVQGTSVSSWAASRTVTTLAENGSGSLRSAIAASVAGDAITFAPGLTGTMVLTNGQLTIGRNLTITGPGRDVVSIDGKGASRVLEVLTNTVANISGLTITNGGDIGTAGTTAPAEDGEAGGILNRGTLVLTECSVLGHRAVGGRGQNNSPSGDARAGGILNFGTLRLVGCFVSRNTASAGDSSDSDSDPGHAEGGGILNFGTITAIECTLSHNEAHGGTFISGASPSEDAASAQGGGIKNYGILRMTACTLNNNRASGGGRSPLDTDHDGGPGSGGAIFNEGELYLTNCTITANTATGGGSGGAISTRGGEGNGGGLLTTAGGASVIVASTISRNSSFGGGTFANGTGGAARGGGIISASDFILSTIISGNTVTGGSGATVGTIFGPDVLGSVVSQGFNLIGATNNSSGWISGDLRGNSSAPLDPQLGPLLNNGGSTFTLALPAESAAVDKGKASGLTVDQRGFSRHINLVAVPNAAGGDGADIGAFELLPLVDIGLRLFDGTATNRIACESSALSGLTSPLRIAKNGTIYGIHLSATNSPQASRFYIQTSGEPKALTKLP